MKRYTVSLVGTIKDAERHRRALTSLPNHFVIVEGETADAYLCSQSDTLKNYFPHSVFVCDEPIHAFAQETERLNVIPAFHYLPFIQELPIAKADVKAAFANLEMTCLIPNPTETSIASHLFEVLAIIRALTGKAALAESHIKTASGHMISGRIAENNSTFTLSLFKSPLSVGQLEILGVSKTQRLTIAIQSDQSARPGTVETFNEIGSSYSWLAHQNSHRLTWLKAYDYLRHTASNADMTFKELRLDLSAAKALLATPSH